MYDEAASGAVMPLAWFGLASENLDAFTDDAGARGAAVAVPTVPCPGTNRGCWEWHTVIGVLHSMHWCIWAVRSQIHPGQDSHNIFITSRTGLTNNRFAGGEGFGSGEVSLLAVLAALSLFCS